MKTRKIRLAHLATRAVEAVRTALETLHGARIEFWQVDISPSGSDDFHSDVEIVAVYSLAGSIDKSISVFASITMEKKDGLWKAISAKLNVSHDRIYYDARWNGQAVEISERTDKFQ